MTKFQKQCEDAERSTGVSLSCFDPREDGKKSINAIEDDGALIIHKGSKRAIFHTDQDQPLREQNRRILAVLTALGLQRFIVQCQFRDEDVVREEEEEEGRYECPHCGNRHD